MSTDPADDGARRRLGIGLALVTALVSGVSVFVNGYGVRRFDDATVYTTAKNLVAAVVILTVAAAATAARRHAAVAPPQQPPGGPGRRDPVLLALVAVVGGSVPFVLFFEGLARVSSPDASYIHKTLVVWVAVLAVPFLGERLAPWHLVAIGALLLGEAELRGGVGWPDRGTGELLVLAATLCWAVEVVLVKHLLARQRPLVVSRARMAGGSVVLLGWLAASGRIDDLAALGGSQWGWALLTGGLLSLYVISWHQALAKAPAIDVSAVLVAGALVTATLDWAVNGTPLAPVGSGLGLIVVGVAVIVVAPRARRPRPAVSPAGGS